MLTENEHPMTPEQIERIKQAAQQWEITIQTREPGYEWWKVAFAVKTPEDGEVIVKLLNETISLKYPPES